eukprot:TRINITY_DN15149_c0_g1_i1.p1 TRINITY_DN15149_c0_g1~~TRINITY_DN15149_c0_g1_i1.p1  ORF type:complete len:118 (-),score=0.71 TRINITY_DN15149_c0_g1_i1:8-361(-)
MPKRASATSGKFKSLRHPNSFAQVMAGITERKFMQPDVRGLDHLYQKQGRLNHMTSRSSQISLEYTLPSPNNSFCANRRFQCAISRPSTLKIAQLPAFAYETFFNKTPISLTKQLQA